LRSLCASWLQAEPLSNQGGLEFMTRSSTLSDPFYATRPAGLPAHLPSVQIMSVDILPASIPRDASVRFSEKVMEYLTVLVREYRGESAREGDDAEREKALGRATIARDGGLVVRFAWLGERVEAWRRQQQQQLEDAHVMSNGQEKDRRVSSGTMRTKRVLVLGSGMVAQPAVDEMAKRADVEVVVG
jgi:alpha-aminoadipic semialdehyde synthase